MSHQLREDTSGDLVVENGSLQSLVHDEGVSEAAQRIRSRLLTVKGEWFLNVSFGLDYRGVIWKKSIPSQVRDAHIQRQALLSAGQGSKVRSYSAEVNGETRTLTVSMDVQLASGETAEAGFTTGV